LQLGELGNAGKELPGQTLAEAEISVLKRLELGGPATTADLARAERITPQSMGALVATLESATYLARTATLKMAADVLRR